MSLAQTYLGITSHGHDASVALIRGDKILFAAHAERYCGEKNTPSINAKLLEDCLQYGQPDKIAYFEQPLYKRARQLLNGQWSNALSTDTVTNHIKSFPELATLPIQFVHHHEAHAANGFYTSGLSDAVIIVVDAVGEFEAASIWHGQSGKPLRKVWARNYPHSMGMLYTAFVDRLGFKPNEDEYVLMGLSAYGNSHRFYHDIHRTFIDDDNFPNIILEHNVHRGIKWWNKDTLTPADHADVAASIQAIFTLYMTGMLHYAKSLGLSNNVVLAGGCALNCACNGELARYRIFDNMRIPVNPGDAGSAIGAVTAVTNRHVEFDSPFLGHDITGKLNVRQVVDELKATGVVGIASGRAEFGPRALGNRSLLADPRNPQMQELLNNIKGREEFRPFAPVVLSEHLEELFETHAQVDYKYMQYATDCKVTYEYPVVAHINGSSRVQSIPLNWMQYTPLREILELWYKETGCPMLLNTSLNIKGKPIVNDLADALAFNIATGIQVFTGI